MDFLGSNTYNISSFFSISFWIFVLFASNSLINSRVSSIFIHIPFNYNMRTCNNIRKKYQKVKRKNKSPTVALRPSGTLTYTSFYTDYICADAKSLITAGVFVSNPTTSRLPASLGSAMVNPVEVIPTTIIFAFIPMT